jgi:hypothetical protein
VSRLEAAKEWYEAQQQALAAIDEWMRGRPDVPRVLMPLVKDYYDKKAGRERFKQERAELNRIALVRLFAGFEADFRARFSVWLKIKLDTVHPDPSAQRTLEGIASALPDSIESCLILFRSFEPRFHGSQKLWLDKLRKYRNEVMHGGFAEIESNEDPISAYESLKRILAYLEVA